MIRRHFIGLSAGNSLYGVDAALVSTQGVGRDLGLSLEHFLHLPYSNELRDLLVRAANHPTPEMERVATLHRVVGEHQALAVRQLLEQSRILPRDILAVGCSGISWWHDTDGRYPSALSLGMTPVIAERTGLTVMSDFSSRDIASGGHGLPLTALVDAMLFHDDREHRVLVHLGSVASVVSLPSQLGYACRDVIGFQAAPCMMLLDGLMRLLTNGRESYDAGGKHAVQGRCLESLLERWMQNHFFQRRPPKCVPRWEFGTDFLNRAVEQATRIDGSLHDVLCAMTHFVARAIVHAMQTYLPTPPTRVLVSGRGVRNGFLWRLLEQMIAGVPLEKTDAYGLPAESRQAVCPAGLAALMMDGVPINLPSVTGASGPRLLGTLTPGDSHNWARCLTWMARQAAPVQAVAA